MPGCRHSYISAKIAIHLTNPFLVLLRHDATSQHICAGIKDPSPPILSFPVLRSPLPAWRRFLWLARGLSPPLVPRCGRRSRRPSTILLISPLPPPQADGWQMLLIGANVKQGRRINCIGHPPGFMQPRTPKICQPSTARTPLLLLLPHSNAAE